MRAGHAALDPFPDPRSLLEYLRGSAGTQAAKNSVLRALLACRQHDIETACVILTLGLWPGLDRVYRTLCNAFPCASEEVSGELIGAFTQSMLKADIAKIESVAATLVRNAKRDTTRTLEGHMRFAQTLDPQLETHVTTTEDGPRNSEPVLCERDGAVLRDRLVQDFGADAELVYDVAVNGFSQRQAAERRGLPYDVARKRHQRTSKRIRENRPDYLSPRVPIRTSGWHLPDDDTEEDGVPTGDANHGMRQSTRTTSRVVPPLGVARDPADRRRVPDRARRGDN